MTPHQPTPQGEALAAVQAILADLAANGVTDMCTDSSYNWAHSLTRATVSPSGKRFAEKTQNPPHSRSAKTERKGKDAPKQNGPQTAQQPALKPAPKPTPKPVVKTPELPPLKLENILWHTGVEKHRALHLFTGAMAEQKGEMPFTPAEKELLTNMLSALHFTLENTASTAIATTAEDGIPHALESLMEHKKKIQKEIPAQTPLLVFGQVAARILTGHTELSLTALRENAQAGQYDEKNNGHPIIITYHPRTLLKQPALKRLVWQDFCAYLNRTAA